MNEERRLERDCVAMAEDAGWMSYKFDRNGGRKGWPDRGFWGPNGDHVMVEFKTSTGALSPLQSHYREQFVARGHTYVVVRSVDGFRGVLRVYEE